MKEGYQKTLKKVTVFSFEPSPFQWTKLSKQKGLGTSDQSLCRLRNKFRKIPLLVMYCLTKFDDKYKAVFELFQKLHLQICASQFMTS